MSPTYREDQTKPVCFMKKISLIKKNLKSLRFMIFALIVEIHCNGKNPNSQNNQIFLGGTDFLHETDLFRLVLLYMWVTYELM